MADPKILQTQLWLKEPLEEIWEFHRNPQNLVKISPDFLKLSLVGVPPVIDKGASFQIVTENSLFRPFLKWSVEYIDWSEEPDHKYFIDVQKDGPFELWKHRHDFKRGITDIQVGDKVQHPKVPGTWLMDTVEYSLKPQFRKFSWVAEKMVTQLFVFRKRRLEKMFRRHTAED